MIRFCPPNSSFSFSDIWENGISECLMETVSSTALSSFLLLFGTIQMVIYWRYATLNTTFVRNSSTKLYKFQVFLLILFPIFAVSRFILWSFIYKDSEILGYMLLTTSLTVICYPFTFALMYKERHYQLPSLPSRGHGLVLLIFWTLSFVVENLSFINLKNEEWWFDPTTQKKKIEMTLFVCRYITTLLIFVIGLKAPGLNWINLQQDEEPLTEGNNNANQSAFHNVWSKIRTLLPYLWPKQLGLQIKVLICIFLLIVGRVVKLFLPIYRKNIVDSLTETPIVFPWEYVLIFVGLSFIQGGGTGSMGLLNNLRSYLWIGVQQYTEREIQVDLFRHLHSLSLRWHLQRKTGEVLRVMDRGTDSINNLLNYIIFQISPTIIDIIVACVFFIYAFNWWFGLIVFLTMFLYILATILVTEWRTKFQRNMNLADNAQRARSVDSLLNFETVKYYGAEKYEVQAYRKAILDFQIEEWRSMVTLNILNTSQNIILCLGLLSGSMLCVYQVAYHQGLTVGDYVLFFTYLMDLYMPLNWFGTYYRAIQKNFVDMENMFDLLKEEEEIVDDPQAKPLLTSGGEIEFSKVTFGYSPDNLVLKDVSFSVPSGKTVAIVGPSGAGKSTIVRLIFRFYDVNGGAILVDGQDIKLLQQESLRKNIGVVPQDTVLFNNTIFYNIEYGKIGSGAEEVFEAARNADIHDRILSFPDRYDTKVGERGLRLSGGEKQRVAIARTLLKAPAIVLLDEATSALDTNTERNIQAALASVCTNRTTLIIAHRLSTIIHADEILVLKEGSIAERGRHEALLHADGIYASMWNQQLQNLEAGNGSNDTAKIEEVILNGGQH